MEEYLAPLIEKLKLLRNPEKATGAKKYLKNQFEPELQRSIEVFVKIHQQYTASLFCLLKF